MSSKLDVELSQHSAIRGIELCLLTPALRGPVYRFHRAGTAAPFELSAGSSGHENERLAGYGFLVCRECQCDDTIRNVDRVRHGSLLFKNSEVGVPLYVLKAQRIVISRKGVAFPVIASNRILYFAGIGDRKRHFNAPRTVTRPGKNHPEQTCDD